jgi:hypothetical protein
MPPVSTTARRPRSTPVAGRAAARLPKSARSAAPSSTTRATRGSDDRRAPHQRHARPIDALRARPAPQPHAVALRLLRDGRAECEHVDAADTPSRSTSCSPSSRPRCQSQHPIRRPTHGSHLRGHVRRRPRHPRQLRPHLRSLRPRAARARSSPSRRAPSAPRARRRWGTAVAAPRPDPSLLRRRGRRRVRGRRSWSRCPPGRRERRGPSRSPVASRAVGSVPTPAAGPRPARPGLPAARRSRPSGRRPAAPDSGVGGGGGGGGGATGMTAALGVDREVPSSVNVASTLNTTSMSFVSPRTMHDSAPSVAHPGRASAPSSSVASSVSLTSASAVVTV